MIRQAREVQLKPNVRKVLEAWCHAPSTAQSHAKRARIVLLAAEGRSTRSIAKEVRVQPRIISNWRRGFADERSVVQVGRAVAGAHRCILRSIQRDSGAICMDQKEGVPAAVQKSPSHPAVIASSRAD
jgi:hypothetical protein